MEAKPALASATSVQVRMPTELVLTPRSMPMAAPTTKAVNSTIAVPASTPSPFSQASTAAITR
jgi:hypothetical protein